MNQIVVRYQDGHLLKGMTEDFLPHRNRFHLLADPAPPREIQLDQLKAVFFVRDLVGDSRRQKSNLPVPGIPVHGRKVRVVFEDGEVLVGTTEAYHADAPGFFITPVDPRSNNQRCFVVAKAVRELSFI